MLPLTSAVPRVMASAPLPPIKVSVFCSVPAFAALSRVSLSEPAPRSMDIEVVSAPTSDIVSAAEPPATVSTLATVALLAKLPKVSVSLPPARSTLAF